MNDRLNNLYVVLVGPKSEGNVGSVARAMANMGVPNLILCNKRCDVGKEAYWRACEGASILKNCAMLDSIEEVSSQFPCLIGTTARLSERREPIVTPLEILPHISTLLETSKVSLIFGPEEAGLDNETLRWCHHLVRIPIVEDSSLNLAHAVCILLYEIRCYVMTNRVDGLNDQKGREEESIQAECKEIEFMIRHFQEAGQAIDYFQPHSELDILWKYRRLFHRTNLTRNEVRMIRGFFHQVLWRINDLKKGDKNSR